MFPKPELTYKMNPLPRYSFEMGPFRPPSEGRSRSLLKRVTQEAWGSIENESPDTEAVVEKATLALKQRDG